MAEIDDARDQLLRLRDEIRDWYQASPTTELRYAMLIPVGERHAALSSLHSWDMPPSNWEAFPKRKRSSPPICCGSHRRHGRHQEFQHCAYGNVTDSELRRFEDWATEAAMAAAAYLRDCEKRLGRFSFDYIGWMLVCHYIGVNYYNKVSYSINSSCRPDSLGDRNADPFSDWEAFDAYERGDATLKEGRYFASFSRDVRICSASAISAILDQSTDDSPKEPKKNNDPQKG